MSTGRFVVVIRRIGGKPSETRVEFVVAGNVDYAVSRLIEAGLLDPRTEVVSIEEDAGSEGIEVDA